MKSPLSSSEASLDREIELLRRRVAELEQCTAGYEESLRRLKQKEAFNFALFQYNPVLTMVVDTEGRVVKSNRAKMTSGDRLPNIGDVMYKDYAARHEIDMHTVLMECLKTGTSRSFPELHYGSKILSVTISPFPGGAIITSQDITERKVMEQDRLKLIDKLRQALGEVETLRGLLPICASCKKIRDDHGYWNHIESYLRKHTMADFTHTLCPECVKQYYPGLWKKLEKSKENVPGIQAQ